MGVGRPTSVAKGGVENEGTDKVTAINDGDKLGTGHTSAPVVQMAWVGSVEVWVAARGRVGAAIHHR
jgi:hypothetical protein